MKAVNIICRPFLYQLPHLLSFCRASFTNLLYNLDTKTELKFVSFYERHILVNCVILQLYFGVVNIVDSVLLRISEIAQSLSFLFGV